MFSSFTLFRFVSALHKTKQGNKTQQDDDESWTQKRQGCAVFWFAFNFQRNSKAREDDTNVNRQAKRNSSCCKLSDVCNNYRHSSGAFQIGSLFSSLASFDRRRRRPRPQRRPTEDASHKESLQASHFDNINCDFFFRFFSLSCCIKLVLCYHQE